MARWIPRAWCLLLVGCAHAPPPEPPPSDDRWACATLRDAYWKPAHLTETCFEGVSTCERSVRYDQQVRQSTREPGQLAYTSCAPLEVVWCFKALDDDLAAQATHGLSCQSTQARCETMRGNVGAAGVCTAHGKPTDDAPAAPEIKPEPPKYACFTFQFAHTLQTECHKASRCEAEQSDRHTQPLVSDFTPCAPVERVWCFVHQASFASPPVTVCVPDAGSCARAREKHGLTTQPGTQCTELK